MSEYMPSLSPTRAIWEAMQLRRLAQKNTVTLSLTRTPWKASSQLAMPHSLDEEQRECLETSNQGSHRMRALLATHSRLFCVL